MDYDDYVKRHDTQCDSEDGDSLALFSDGDSFIAMSVSPSNRQMVEVYMSKDAAMKLAEFITKESAK